MVVDLFLSEGDLIGFNPLWVLDEVGYRIEKWWGNKARPCRAVSLAQSKEAG